MSLQTCNYVIHADESNAKDRILKDIFTNDEYLAAFGEKTIVDVGACIGLFSMYAYPFAKKIYAIEPHPVNYGNLLKNVEENSLKNIETFPYAISDENGIGFMRMISCLEGSSFDKLTGDYEVISKTLATFFQEQNISYADIVKIDVEGHERAICNAMDFDSLRPKIGKIIMEVHGGENMKIFGFEGHRVHSSTWVYNKI